MRDVVAFLVKLPEGATAPKGPGIFWKGFCRKMRYEAKKSRQGKRYPASCRATCVMSRQESLCPELNYVTCFDELINYF